jgi:hypothetical protein
LKFGTLTEFDINASRASTLAKKEKEEMIRLEELEKLNPPKIKTQVFDDVSNNPSMIPPKQLGDTKIEKSLTGMGNRLEWPQRYLFITERHSKFEWGDNKNNKIIP